MITNNYKKFAATMLLATPNSSWSDGVDNHALFRYTDWYGSSSYFYGWYGGFKNEYGAMHAFPAYIEPEVWYLGESAPASGIVIGSGSTPTPATADDYRINEIADVYGNVEVHNSGTDENGNPFITFRCTVYDTVGSGFYMTEIGYSPMITANTGISYMTPVLFDRTVLESAIYIGPQENPTTFDYTLKTIWN